MKNIFSFPVFAVIVFMLFSCGNSDLQLRESSFSRSLSPVGRILVDSSWTNWDMAPVYDEEGIVHLYVGRWHKGTSWLKKAQIVHFTATDPAGPYHLEDTVLQCDTMSYYNPQIRKVGSTYVLVYSYRSSSWPNLHQQIGLATSPSPAGPWKQSEHNPVIAPSFVPGSPNCLHASNPTFLQDKERKYRIYYKSISDKPDDPNLRTISLAISDHIEGPYTNYTDNPLIGYTRQGLDVEDPYAFLYKGSYYIILEDRRGVRDYLEGKEPALGEIREGGVRPGLIYRSADGISWDRPEIGYQANSYYFDESLKRMERPHILWKDGKPDYLFLALEKDRFGLGSGAVLKINAWD